MRNTILFVALGAVHAAQSALTTCNADNCLRAVKNTAMPARGSSDCASYLGLGQTVTASATTIIRTVTVTSSPSSTVTSTTSTETSVATSIVFARQAPASSNAIPSYASLCSGAVRYSSACACIGATGSTVTVSGPTSYSTVTSTSTLATGVVLTTQTFQTTVPATSTTETDFTTIYAPTATSISDVDASTTITSTSTSTTSQPTLPPFCLLGSASGNNYVLSNVGQSGTNIIAKHIDATSPPTLIFTLDSAGHLITSAGYKVYVIGVGKAIYNDPQNIRPVQDSTVAANPNNYTPLICSATSIGGSITCTATPTAGTPYYTQFLRYTPSDTGIVAMSSNNPPQSVSAYYASITFTLSTSCPA